MKGQKSTQILRESDLFEPLARYWSERGFRVQGENGGCDLTAVLQDTLVIVEMKLRFNLELLLQASQRLDLSDQVYIALPRKATGDWRKWRKARKLLKRLGVGLMIVSGVSGTLTAEVVFHPLPYQGRTKRAQKQLILGELSTRKTVVSTGGVNRRKIVTVYRENAVHIACALEQLGQASPKHLRELGTGARTLSILSSNFYGWFERIGRGLYRVSERWLAEKGQFPETVAYFDQQPNRDQDE